MRSNSPTRLMVCACWGGTFCPSAGLLGNCGRGCTRAWPRGGPNAIAGVAMINWIYYPKCDRATDTAKAVVAAFESASAQIDSTRFNLKSNAVLAHVAASLASAG